MYLLFSAHSSLSHLAGSTRRSRGAAAMSCFGKAPSPVSLLFLGRKQLPLTKEEQFW